MASDETKCFRNWGVGLLKVAKTHPCTSVVSADFRQASGLTHLQLGVWVQDRCGDGGGLNRAKYLRFSLLGAMLVILFSQSPH